MGMKSKQSISAHDNPTLHKEVLSLIKSKSSSSEKPKKISEECASLWEDMEKSPLKSKKQKETASYFCGKVKSKNRKKINEDKKIRSLGKDIDFGRAYDEVVRENKLKTNSTEHSILSNVIESKLVDTPLLEELPQTKVELPIVEATVVTTVDAIKDEVEIKDRALRIALDFTKHENLILVGGIKYLYNGTFYAQLTDRDLQSYLFRKYYHEIRKGNAVSVLGNATKLVDFCIKDRYEEFPLNEDLIIFENGKLQVSTERFRMNSPEDIANSSLDIRYNGNRYDMPSTQKFLENIADGDKELYELMLQVIGYILSNDMRAKSFFYLEGVGDAGKSRFCDLIASFFPNSGANKVGRVALQDLDGKFALGNLVNSKLNISEDLPDRPLSPVTVSRIKMLSDSNRLEAEAKYVQKFSFRPTCKFLFASNHPLRLKEYDQAFVNRVVYIPFLKAVPKEKQDRDILRKMQGELPALFNHAFEAYKRLVNSGYSWAGSEKFKPRIEIVGTGITLNKVGELKEFVDTCCSYQSDSITPVADLQAAYNLFCRQRNFLPIQGARFSRELRQVFSENVIPTKIGNSCRGYKGIQVLKPYLPTEFEEFD